MQKEMQPSFVGPCLADHFFPAQVRRHPLDAWADEVYNSVTCFRNTRQLRLEPMFDIAAVHKQLMNAIQS